MLSGTTKVKQKNCTKLFIPKHLKKAFKKLLTFRKTSIESALRKFNDSVLHAAECMRRTIWVNTGTERDTNKWFDREYVQKKRVSRFKSVNRFLEDKVRCRQTNL